MDPVGFARPFGDELPVVLVTFAGKLASGLDVVSGPVVAVVSGRAEVPWGTLTGPWPVGFYVDDKPYLWSGESGEDCGARLDQIYAVEGDRLRRVASSALRGD